MFVCQHDNSWTIRDIIIKFSGQHPRVQREANFENGYRPTAEGVWWRNVSDVL